MTIGSKHACNICEFLLQNNHINERDYERLCKPICYELNFDIEYNNELSKRLIDYCLNNTDIDLALRMGKIELSRFPLLELGALIQPNYLLALQFIIVHQMHTFPFVKIEMKFDKFFYFTLEPFFFNDPEDKAYIFIIEYHLSQLLNIVKSLVPTIKQPKKIFVTFPKKKDQEIYKKYLNCEIIYNHHENKMIFELSQNALTERAYNLDYLFIQEKILNILENLKATSKQDSELKNKIHLILNQSINDFPNEETLASYLNMHPRTLRRKLKSEGETFRKIVTEFKMKKAINLLMSTKLNYKQIAYHLGFKSSTSFIKSFKNWTGYPPKKYRNFK